VGVAIVDIDGVLADVRHRVHFVQSRPKDWDAFFAAAPQDALLPQGLARARDLAQRADLVYLTGRPERCRADTEAWLAAHDFPEGRLLMRPDDDRRPARRFKLEQVRALSGGTTVEIIVDDDAQVVAALLDAGFPVEHAQWMTADEPQQQSLFDAQEREGRT
jgi:hypothetical protein